MSGAGAGGSFRRVIDLRRRADGSVAAWLEDDFHHFGVRLAHAAGRVVSVTGAARRFPYSTCPGAADSLSGMVGGALSKRSTDVGQLIDMRLQCTHLFDLAGLAMAHAAAGRQSRRYEAEVPDRPLLRDGDGRKRFGTGEARLWRDGELVLQWVLDGDLIVGPGPWAQRSLQAGFRAFSETLEPEAAEAACVLRRAVFVSGGRRRSAEARLPPAQARRGAVCHTFQPGHRASAQPVDGSRRDWSASSRGMLGDLGDG